MADYKVIDAEKLDADLTTVADAIRSKGGTTEPLSFPQGMASAVNAIQSGNGGITPTGTIEITENGTHDVANYASANVNVQSGGGNKISLIKYATNLKFTNAIFPVETEFEEDISGLTDISSMFSNVKMLKRIKLKHSNNDLTLIANSSFQQVTNLEELDLTEFLPHFTNCGGTFRMCPVLKKIHVLNFEHVTNANNAFYDLPELQEIYFVENTISISIALSQSPLLTDESIQSIIDGLATVTTAQTLTLHANVKAKLTDAQLTTITSKNWTLA